MFYDCDPHSQSLYIGPYFICIRISFLPLLAGEFNKLCNTKDKSKVKTYISGWLLTQQELSNFSHGFGH